MRRRKTKSNIPLITLSCLLAAAIVGCALLFWRDFTSRQTITTLSSELEQLDAAQAALEADADTRLSQLQEQLGSAVAARDELAAQLTALSAERDELAAQLTADDVSAEYEARLQTMREQLTRRENEVVKLTNTIENLETVYSLDLNKQFALLNSLNELLENPPEYDTGEVELIIDENGEEIEQPIMAKHKVSIYYEDIANGYKYAFDADTAYSTASLIKAPFVLAVLRQAVAEDDEIKAALEAGELTLEQVENYPRVYDFTKIFTYSEEFYAEGSGRIKDDTEKTEYTYLELFDYLMRYSDNVAYSVLKDEYGIDSFRAMVYELGCTSMYKSLSYISAADCAKVMRAVYEFIDEGNIYSEFLYEVMTNSAHSVMITSAVYPNKVAHKYGWDSEVYHDMGIVYAENPYVVSVLSDMSEGGDTVNDYVRQIVRLIASLHGNFYSEKMG